MPNLIIKVNNYKMVVNTINGRGIPYSAIYENRGGYKGVYEKTIRLFMELLCVSKAMIRSTIKEKK